MLLFALDYSDLIAVVHTDAPEKLKDAAADYFDSAAAAVVVLASFSSASSSCLAARAGLR